MEWVWGGVGHMPIDTGLLTHGSQAQLWRPRPGFSGLFPHRNANIEVFSSPPPSVGQYLFPWILPILTSQLRTAVSPKAEVHLAVAGSSRAGRQMNEQEGWEDNRVRREEAGCWFVFLFPVSSHIPTHPSFQELSP